MFLCIANRGQRLVFQGAASVREQFPLCLDSLCHYSDTGISLTRVVTPGSTNSSHFSDPIRESTVSMLAFRMLLTELPRPLRAFCVERSNQPLPERGGAMHHKTSPTSTTLVLLAALALIAA